MITVVVAASASGDNEIVAAVAGVKYRVVAFLLSFSGTVNAKFRSATTDKTGLVYGLAGVVAASPTLPARGAEQGPNPQFDTAAGEALNLNLSANVAVGGYVVYERLPASG